MSARPVHCPAAYCRARDLLRGALGGRRDAPPWPQFAGRRVYLTYQGRVAIAQLALLWNLGAESEVLMPAYNCGSEVDPWVWRGCRVTLYRVDGQARLDVDDVRGRLTPQTRVIYATHYFGWVQDLGELRAICDERGIRLVEDCAMALFSAGPPGPAGTSGDAAIYSLRKLLPLPDGGALALRAADASATPRLAAPPSMRTLRDTLPFLKGQAIRGAESVGAYGAICRWAPRHRKSSAAAPAEDDRYPDIPKDYYFAPATAGWSISVLSRNMLARLDPEQIRQRRRDNYLELRRALEGAAGVTPLLGDPPPGVCPMGLPLVVRDRRRWVDELAARGIAAFPFWEGYHRELRWDGFDEARYLKDHVLLLPVHPALGAAHRAYIADTMWALSRRFG
jgi:dTDP-4-amino-4,6-dideoxygalactose transaminase